jgi:hypothetical protein
VDGAPFGALVEPSVDVAVDGFRVEPGKREAVTEQTRQVAGFSAIALQRAVGAALVPAVGQESPERRFERGFVRGSVRRIGGSSLPLKQTSFGGPLVGALGAPLVAGAVRVVELCVPSSAAFEESACHAVDSFRRRYTSSDAREIRIARPMR